MEALDLRAKVARKAGTSRVQLQSGPARHVEDSAMTTLNSAVISGPTIPCARKLASAAKPTAAPRYYMRPADAPTLSDAELLPPALAQSDARAQAKAAALPATLQCMLDNRKQQSRLKCDAALECLNRKTEYIADFGLRALRGMGYHEPEPEPATRDAAPEL